MKIDRNNYEIYFLDYLEGNLKPEKEAELLAFLEEHPHLKEAFENFGQIHLTPLEVFFEKKEELKKAVSSFDIIDESNCEHYFVAYLEGDLPGDKKQEVQDFLKIHPKYLSSFELQQRAKLVADNSIFYPGNQLRKSIFERSGVKPFYFYASAAAAVFIIFFVYFYNNSEQATDKKIIAEKKTPKFSVKQQEKKPERDKTKTGIEVVVTAEKQRNKKSTVAQSTSKNKLVIKSSNPSANLVADNINKESITKEGLQQKDSLAFIEMPLAENNNQEQKISKALSGSSENEFLSIKELMVVKFKKAVNSEEATGPGNENNRKLSFWNLADMVAGGISKLTGKTWKVNKKYNETGDVSAFAVISDKFEFSRKIKMKKNAL